MGVSEYPEIIHFRDFPSQTIQLLGIPIDGKPHEKPQKKSVDRDRVSAPTSNCRGAPQGTDMRIGLLRVPVVPGPSKTL